MIQSMLLIGTLRHLSSPASRLHAVSRIISICIFIVIIIMNNPFVGLNWNQRDMDAFIALVYLRQVLRRRRRRRRRYWVRPWLQRRPMLGQYPQIQTYYTRYVHVTYSRAGVLVRNVQQEFFVPTSIMCGAYAPRMRDLRVECWHIPAQEFWRATYNKNYSSLRRSCAVRTRHVCVTYVLNVGNVSWMKTNFILGENIQEFINSCWNFSIIPSI